MEIILNTYESAELAFSVEKHVGALLWILFVRYHVLIIIRTQSQASGSQTGSAI